MQPDLAELVADIRSHHRRRNFAMRQRQRLDMSLGSFLRAALGWRRLDDDEPRDKAQAALNEEAKRRAAALVEVGEAAMAAAELEAVAASRPLDGREERRLARLREQAVTDDPAYATFAPIIAATLGVRKPFETIEAEHTEQMERLAAQLPVWPRLQDIRGFTPRSLAIIVGEAGDLAAYPTASHLWKRMGVAVIGRGDGVADKRQGGLPATAPAEEWQRHGYNRARRSRLFVIGDVQVKMGDHYRAVYLARKAYEARRAEAAGVAVVPAAKIPRGRREGFMSEGQVHRRAQRYMEKRLLRDVWRAWNADRQANCRLPDAAIHRMPADPHLDAA